MKKNIKRSNCVFVIALFVVMLLPNIASALGLINVSPAEGNINGGNVVKLDGEFVKRHKFTQMSNGYNHVVALGEDDKIYSWGANSFGQLGDGTIASSNIPVEIDMTGVLAGKTIKNVFTTGYSSYATDMSGALYSWGRNSFGVLGNGATDIQLRPIVFTKLGAAAGKSIDKVVGGGVHTLVMAEGKAYGIGQNNLGQLGDDTTTNRNVLTSVHDSGILAGETVIDMADQASGGMAITANGLVASWGQNQHGQLGENSAITYSDLPVATEFGGLANVGKIIQISGGRYFSIALDDKGQVYAWGQNNQGQLGTNDLIDHSAPYRVDNSLLGGKIKSIGSGVEHSMALNENGELYAWGMNARAEIGNGQISVTPVLIPEKINSSLILSANIAKISSKYSTSYLLTDEGWAYSWGVNSGSEGGVGITSYRLLAATRVLHPVLSTIDYIQIGNNRVNNFTIIDDNTIEFAAPAHAEGLVDIKVANTLGEESELIKSYKYVDNNEEMAEIKAPNTGVENEK